MKYKSVHSVLLDCSREEAWEKLKDLSLAPRYVPGVASMSFLTERKKGLGATRRVFPQKLDEEVIGWEEGKEVVLGLSKSGKQNFFPFERALFRYLLMDGKPVSMELSMEYDSIFGSAGHLLFGGIIDSRIKKTALALREFYNKK
ncbi:MAG: SRPBCC family protein [Clostridia bacterium]